MKAEAASNMKQVHSSIMLYAQDNDTFLPPYWNSDGIVRWWEYLKFGGYLGNVYDEEESGNANDMSILGSPALRSLHPEIDGLATFMINGSIGLTNPSQTNTNPGDPNRVKRYLDFKDPAVTALFFEGKTNAAGTQYQFVTWPNSATQFPPDAVYGDSCLIIYADGHVDTIRIEDIPKTSNISDTRGRLFWRGY